VLQTQNQDRIEEETAVVSKRAELPLKRVVSMVLVLLMQA
jgi:hypothetical protein